MMTNFFLIGLWDRSCLKVFEKSKRIPFTGPLLSHTYLSPSHKPDFLLWLDPEIVCVLLSV